MPHQPSRHQSSFPNTHPVPADPFFLIPLSLFFFPIVERKEDREKRGCDAGAGEIQAREPDGENQRRKKGPSLFFLTVGYPHSPLCFSPPFRLFRVTERSVDLRCERGLFDCRYSMQVGKRRGPRSIDISGQPTFSFMHAMSALDTIAIYSTVHTRKRERRSFGK